MPHSVRTPAPGVLKNRLTKIIGMSVRWPVMMSNAFFRLNSMAWSA